MLSTRRNSSIPGTAPGLVTARSESIATPNKGTAQMKIHPIDPDVQKLWKGLVSDLRNLRKNVALPSTRLVDPSLRSRVEDWRVSLR
jgi:hypothetical protein